jgi:hypothetical protein
MDLDSLLDNCLVRFFHDELRAVEKGHHRSSPRTTGNSYV